MASRSGELNKLTAFLLYCPEGRGRRNGSEFYKGYNVQYSLSLARLFYCYNGVLSRK